MVLSFKTAGIEIFGIEKCENEIRILLWGIYFFIYIMLVERTDYKSNLFHPPRLTDLIAGKLSENQQAQRPYGATKSLEIEMGRENDSELMT